jgi:hypothetical protein
MPVKTYEVIAFASMISSLIPWFLGLTKFRRISLPQRLLVGLTGASFFCDFISWAGYHLWKIQVNYISTTYILIDFILLYVIYYHALGVKHSKLFFLLGIAYIAFYLSNMIFFQKTNINSYSEVLEASLFIGLSLGYFYKLMKELPNFRIQSIPLFWISVACLFFFCGNLFLFAMTQYLVNFKRDSFFIYWSFHNGLSVIKNIFFAVALSIVPSSKTS